MVVLNQTAPFLNKTAFNSHHLQPSVCKGVTRTKHIIYSLKCTDPRSLSLLLPNKYGSRSCGVFQGAGEWESWKIYTKGVQSDFIHHGASCYQKRKEHQSAPPREFCWEKQAPSGASHLHPRLCDAETPWSLLPRGVWSFNKRSKVTALFEASFHFRNEISLFLADWVTSQKMYPQNKSLILERGQA